MAGIRHEDYTDAIIALKWQFQRLGYSFKHPRVKAWMTRAGFRNEYEMNLAAHEALTRILEGIRDADTGNSTS